MSSSSAVFPPAFVVIDFSFVLLFRVDVSMRPKAVVERRFFSFLCEGSSFLR